MNGNDTSFDFCDPPIPCYSVDMVKNFHDRNFPKMLKMFPLLTGGPHPLITAVTDIMVFCTTFPRKEERTD